MSQFSRWAMVRNTLDVEVPTGWPTGKGDVLVEVIAPGGSRTAPSPIDDLWWPGCGYNIHWSPTDPTKIPRKLSETAKRSIRRKALVRRIEKAAPLFATDLIEQSLAAQPDYFFETEPKK